MKKGLLIDKFQHIVTFKFFECARHIFRHFLRRSILTNRTDIGVSGADGLIG